MTKIEIVCNDIDIDQIVGIISAKGHTGNPRDGIIYVSEIEKSI